MGSAAAISEVVQGAELPKFRLAYVAEQPACDAGLEDWSPERITHAFDEYRRSLALCRAFPSKPIGISTDADHIWRLHILNTRRYMSACDAFFGYNLHHTPISSEAENAAAQQEPNRRTLEVFGFRRTGHSSATYIASGSMNNG